MEDNERRRLPVALNKITSLVGEMLEALGYMDWSEDEGLKDTPDRVAAFWVEFLEYQPGNIGTQFQQETSGQIVMVRGIEFFSLCEHHLLPITGTIDVAYISGHAVLGLSKIPRIVQKHAHKLQLQERMCQQIADDIEGQLNWNCRGVAIRARAVHSCMAHRGIKSDGVMVTRIFTGEFNQPENKAEFYELLK